ncbi:MAG: tetratricopeptide repeat protein [Nostoc sp.]
MTKEEWQGINFKDSNPTFINSNFYFDSSKQLFQTNSQEQLSTFSFYNKIPVLEEPFIGREQLIQNLLSARNEVRLIAILGIPGIGKTSLMTKLTSCFEDESVFWYEFQPGLVSLKSVIKSLAQFLDKHLECREKLVSLFQTNLLEDSEKIALVIERLNQKKIYLFFDSIHHIDGDTKLNSFFSILKQELKQGNIFIASRHQPYFYKSIDELNKRIKVFELNGLSKADTEHFFSTLDISLNHELANKIHKYFGGLPLALQLIAGLLQNNFEQGELLDLINQAKEEAIEQLFEEVYKRLNFNERSLLTTASLFSLPFLKDDVINASNFLFNPENIQESFTNLKRKLLIQKQEINTYKVHQVIQTLALTYSKESYKKSLSKLADYFSDKMQMYDRIQLEVILLYYRSEEFSKSAEVALTAIEQGLIPYYPELAEIILGSFKEDKVIPQIWVWLVGNKGILADFWDRQEEAEEYYQKMLEIASRIDNKFAISIAFQRLGIIYSAKNPEQAEKYYLDSFFLKKELGDIEGQSQIYNNLGSLYIGQQEWVKAEINLEKALNLLNSVSASEWKKLSLYGNLAMLHSERREWAKANEFREKVCKIAEQENLPYELAQSLYNFGVSQNRQGFREQATNNYLSALEIANKHNLYDIQELAYNALGKQSFELENYNTSIEYFQKLIEIQKKARNISKLVVTNFYIACVLDFANDLSQRDIFYKNALELSEKLKNDQEFCITLSNICSLALQASNPRLVVRGLKIFRTHFSKKESYKLAKIYEAIGKIYLEVLGVTRTSKICMYKAASIFGELNIKEEQIGILINFASKHEELENYGHAIKLDTEAIELAESTQLNSLASIAYYNRANCFVKLEMWEEAEKNFINSISILELEDSSNRELWESALHNLGEMYRRCGRFKDAIPLFHLSLEASRKREDIDSEITTLNNLGLAHQEADETEEALAYFNNALTLCCQQYRKSKESNILISLGNYYLLNNQPNLAKNCYENALYAARIIENIDAEESCILSLAYAHRELDTFDTIADEFKIVAERSGEMRHYENFIAFLTFCGDINFDKGNIESSSEMFGKALLVAYFLVTSRVTTYIGLNVNTHTIAHPLNQVHSPICDAMKSAVAVGEADKARKLHRLLVDMLQEHDAAGRWLIDYCLKPIEHHLNNA